MDIDELKRITLNLIEEYNKDESHRKLKPINSYGDPTGWGKRLYWINWSDDNKSTIMFGFTYDSKENSLLPIDSKNKITLDEAIDDFKRQLKEIPLK